MTTATFKTPSHGKDLKVTLIALLVLLIFSACDKTPVKPTPPPADNKTYLQITVTGLPVTTGQLFALLSIDKAGQNIVINKKVRIIYINGVYTTDKVELAKGEFRLTKFLVVTGTDSAVYATPKANTPRAAAVSQPLSLPVAVQTTGINNVSAQVVKIEQTDQPELFGYSSDDFGYSSYLSVKVKLQMMVGRIVYDSLPGSLKVEAWGENNSHWIREIDIQRGASTIQVPDHYTSYSFTAEKWNVLIRKDLVRAGIQANMTISINGVREPKRLVEEATFIEKPEGLVPDTRTVFLYGGGNKLAEARHYQKFPTRADLELDYIYTFKYLGGILDTIIRVDPGIGETGYTAFYYFGGKIASISDQNYDQHTDVAFEYLAAGENETIGADYFFDNNKSMYNRFFTLNGNRSSEIAHSSTGSGEIGRYEYDDNINPKHQLGWDDIFLSNYSKNNLVKEEKTYTGAFPTSVPYKFEYQYDNDGYPTVVYISYKGFNSQAHLFRIKKVYTYQ